VTQSDTKQSKRIPLSRRLARLYRFGYYLVLEPRVVELAEEVRKIRTKLQH
jgi:hypothetical protein